MRRLIWTVTGVMVGALAIAGAWETASGEYKILRKQKNDDLGYFDYVMADSANRRLYIQNRLTDYEQLVTFGFGQKTGLNILTAVRILISNIDVMTSQKKQS